MTLLIAEGVNSLGGIFLVSHKGSWKGGQSIPGAGNKASSKKEKFLVRKGKRDTGGIILGDNLAGYYFVLRDLVPTNFLKKVMIA